MNHKNVNQTQIAGQYERVNAAASVESLRNVNVYTFSHPAVSVKRKSSGCVILTFWNLWTELVQ